MAHPDVVRLIEYCLDRARKTLAEVGEIEPFAATIGTHNELFPFMLPDADGKATPERLIEDYTAALKKETNTNAIAVALCWDGRLVFEGPQQVTPADEIRVMVEHSYGDSVEVHLPFRKRRLMGFGYGEMVAVKRQRQFFSAKNRT